jgi:hypothetical protein
MPENIRIFFAVVGVVTNNLRGALIERNALTMDENRINILNESTRTISKLQLLTVFFNNDIIYKIYLRTQVIHQLFATNPDLDIGKLELFHLQFTVTLIDLLKKIKKNNESRADLMLDEVQLNNELIGQMDDTIFSENDFANDKQRQALKMSQSLRKLFEVLSNDLEDYPFAKNINLFQLAIRARLLCRDPGGVAG